MASGRLRIGYGSPGVRSLLAEYGQYNLTGQESNLIYTPDPGEGPAPGDIFTASYTSLLGNWDVLVTEGEGTNHVTTFLPGGGPGGLNATRLALVPGGALETYWGNRIYLPNYANGVERYFRWYQKFSAGTNHAGGFVNKMLMLGDDGVGSRMIMQGQTRDFPGVHNVSWQLTFDGLATLTDIPTDEQPALYALNEWHSVQMVTVWGPGTSYIAAWINNDVFGSPTGEAAEGMSFTNSINGDTYFGAYHNDAITGGEEFEWEHAAFRVSTTFDPNWHASMQSLLGG